MERDNIGWDGDAYVLIKREKRGKGVLGREKASMAVYKGWFS
jgi:hypothetical protein